MQHISLQSPVSFGTHWQHLQGVLFNCLIFTQQLAVNTCPNILVVFSLCSDALFSRFHEGHLG